MVELINNGTELSINSGGYSRQVAVLCDGPSIICQFGCGMKTAQGIFCKLEEAATKYLEEGVVTDEINE